MRTARFLIGIIGVLAGGAVLYVASHLDPTPKWYVVVGALAIVAGLLSIVAGVVGVLGAGGIVSEAPRTASGAGGTARMSSSLDDRRGDRRLDGGDPQSCGLAPRRLLVYAIFPLLVASGAGVLAATTFADVFFTRDLFLRNARPSAPVPTDAFTWLLVGVAVFSWLVHSVGRARLCEARSRRSATSRFRPVPSAARFAERRSFSSSS